MSKQTNLISLLLENEAGSLSRVIGLFSQRNFNIESLSVAPSNNEGLSRVNISTHADIKDVEQIVQQLHKIIPVYKIIVLSNTDFTERELILLKLRATSLEEKAEIHLLADTYQAQIIDMRKDCVILQLVSSHKAIEALLSSLSADIIMETNRTGAIGLVRSGEVL